jgi:predicted amidophosphoribosyltransferase
MLRRTTGLLAGRVAAAAGEYRPEVVTWVPSHWRRSLLRGRDHAQVIAARLAGELSLGLEGLLRRVRNTPPQVRLSRTARIENVRGAFEPSCALAGETVLLVDDVTTTGATANEAARQLLSAGAGHVQLAVLAKSEPGEAWRAHIEPPETDDADAQRPA